MGSIYLTPLVAMAALGIPVIFLGAASIKLALRRVVDKAPSRLMQSLAVGIGVEGIPINHVSIIDEECLASVHSVFLPLVRKVRLSVDPFFYWETVSLHNKVEVWEFGWSG